MIGLSYRGRVRGCGQGLGGREVGEVAALESLHPAGTVELRETVVVLDWKMMSCNRLTFMCLPRVFVS